MASRVAERLTAEQSPLRQKGLEVLVDHSLNQRVGDLLPADDVRELIVAALTAENAERLVSRHLNPGRDRVLEHLQRTGETLDDLVPDGFVDEALRMILKSPPPKAAWAKGAVDSAKLRELFAPVVQDVLLKFTRRLPIPGLGEPAAPADARSGRSGGLAGAFKKGAGSLLDAGKGVLGNIGADIERRVQATARELSQLAMNDARDAVRERLRSEEGRRLLREIRQSLVERVLATALHELMADSEQLPLDELALLAPAVVAHNAPRQQLHDLLDQEIAAFLAVEGQRTLGEVLDEAGLLAQGRAAALRVLDEPARALFASDTFAEWVEELLAP